MRNRFLKLASIFSIILALFLTVPLHAQEFYPANVKDVSDRAYEPAVIELLDGAKKSIVMSMFAISEGTKYNNPVKMLVNDLKEARERGVSVTIYLNTRITGTKHDKERVANDSILKMLKDMGCIVYLMPYHQRLHDKLIIVDGRYIIEGSANWTISALRDNYESATLIDSKELAKIKLARLASFSLEPKTSDKKPNKGLYTTNLPKKIAIPKTLLTEKKYLPAMLNRHAAYSMDLYLTLLAYSQAINKRDFFVDLSAMALSMGMPESWSRAELRKQVKKNLKDLKDRYSLINAKFFTNKDAWVELSEIPGEAFEVPIEVIIDDSNPSRVKFYLIAEAMLKSQGEDINALSTRQAGKRLHVSGTVIFKVREDLRGKKGK